MIVVTGCMNKQSDTVFYNICNTIMDSAAIVARYAADGLINIRVYAGIRDLKELDVKIGKPLVPYQIELK